MKRFWTDVRVADDRVIMLDERPMRTPGRAPLALPTDALAQAVAQEWREVGESIDPRAMPLTGLANAAIDRISHDPSGYADELARYGESDLFYYRADAPPELIERQAAMWDGPLAWAAARYDVHFEIVHGIVHRSQPATTVRRLGGAVRALDPSALTALLPIVSVTGTLVGALALTEGALDADALWDAAQVDEAWQEERWGSDAAAVHARAEKRRDYDAAVRFLALSRGAGAGISPDAVSG